MFGAPTFGSALITLILGLEPYFQTHDRAGSQGIPLVRIWGISGSTFHPEVIFDSALSFFCNLRKYMLVFSCLAFFFLFVQTREQVYSETSQGKKTFR